MRLVYMIGWGINQSRVMVAPTQPSLHIRYQSDLKFQNEKQNQRYTCII